MATSYMFNGRLIKLPGVYAEVKSAINNPPANLSYGNILIVDTQDVPFSGGAGIAGEHANGQDAVYGFDNIIDFREFLRGGILWDIASPLFRPFSSAHNGVSNLYYVRPFTTIAATVAMTFTNGNFVIDTRSEGTCGNGVEVTSKVTQGFSVNLEIGKSDIAKFRIRFVRGTFTGDDANGRAWNDLENGDTEPETIAITPEIDTLDEFVTWMAKDYAFLNAFVLVSGQSETGAIVAGDLTGLGPNNLFSGGTQTYSEANLTLALEAIKDLDYTHILSVDYGVNMTDAKNFSLLLHIEDDARYEKFLVVGAGEGKNEFENSKAAAVSYNSDKVILAHGANYDFDRTSASSLRLKTSLHKAAYVLGRAAGIAPQIPPTFKGIGTAGEYHKLTDKEREEALDAGLLTTYYDSEIQAFVITQGISTLQLNDNVVNQDGTSHLWSLKRISAQLNKEIEVNMKVDLLGNQSQGPNRNTLSEEIIRDWVDNYLSRKTATETVDNLIISYRNIIVTTQQDAYKVSYEFAPNLEVNKMFVTGLIIDPNL